MRSRVFVVEESRAALFPPVSIMGWAVRLAQVKIFAFCRFASHHRTLVWGALGRGAARSASSRSRIPHTKCVLQWMPLRRESKYLDGRGRGDDI